MPRIFLVSASHWEIPGAKLSAHTGYVDANGRALEHVQRMFREMKWRERVTSDNFESSLLRLQDYHGAAYVDVTLTGLDLEGVPPLSIAAVGSLKIAESFMSGFEGDELQEGIGEHLADIRNTIARMER